MSDGRGRQKGRGRATIEHGGTTHAMGAGSAPWSQVANAPTLSGRAIHAAAPLRGQPGDKTPGDGNGNANGGAHEARGAMRNQRVVRDLVVTRPNTCVKKQGEFGNEVEIVTNYFRILRAPKWHLYQYRVDFMPDISMMGARKRLITEQKANIGGFIFDGTILFLCRKLPSDVSEFASRLQDETPVITKVKFVNEVSMSDERALSIYNLIIRRCMGALHLQPVGRNLFDAAAAINIPDFNMQLWPGYITSIRQHEKDLLLCAEISHKVMRTETLLQILVTCSQSGGNYRDSFEKKVLGSTVLTAYNNKTYRVTGVDWQRSPSSTFETKTETISFVQYYRKKYNLNIVDGGQPLLLSTSRERDLRGGEEQILALVPELCRATGFTDEMRSNFHIMKAAGDHTRVNPAARVNKLLEFNRRLYGTPDSMAVLNEWEMNLDKDLVRVKGRRYPVEPIFIGSDDKIMPDHKADWTRDFIAKRRMFSSNNVNNWCLITTGRCERDAQSFASKLIQTARDMNFNMSQPRIAKIPDDRKNSYLVEIDRVLQQDPQLLVIVVPNQAADRYGSIKKKCCVDRPVPTQLVQAKHLVGGGRLPEARYRSIVTKICIQINAKLGGIPWMVQMPVSGLMTIGFDVCHDTVNKSVSYGAMIASMDAQKNGGYFSAVSPHRDGTELSNEFALNVCKAIQAYRHEYGDLPKRILIYRDGVGDGQIHQVFEHEVAMIKEKLQQIYHSAGIAEGYKMAFVIVSKRLNTRLFVNGQRGIDNPAPGTIVDDVITLPERYDFFLVSQSVNQGTVSPTSYNVIHDNFLMQVDRLQRLTYKMCHLYYNWSGTTRVPAVCQYAHKLAFLVSQSIHVQPSSHLEKCLYFL